MPMRVGKPPKMGSATDALHPFTRNAARNERRANDKSIVCGVDGSADSQAALAVASDLAARLQLRLIITNVVEPSHGPYVGGPRWRSDAASLTLDHRAAGRGREPGCSSNSARRWGSNRRTNALSSAIPPSGSPTSPTKKELKLIVVGSRGRGAFKAAFLGSVSTTLIGVARCPVLSSSRSCVSIGIPQDRRTRQLRSEGEKLFALLDQNRPKPTSSLYRERDRRRQLGRRRRQPARCAASRPAAALAVIVSAVRSARSAPARLHRCTPCHARRRRALAVALRARRRSSRSFSSCPPSSTV